MAKSLTAIVTGVSVVALWGAALAQIGSTTTGPTQADFEVCNREAQMKVGASPSPITRRGTSTAGVAAAAGAGAAAGGAASGGSTLGGDSTLSGGSALGRVEENVDSQVRGLGDVGENDPRYRAAYRECMKTRGF